MAVLTAALLPFSTLGFLVGGSAVAVIFIALSYVVGTAYMAPSIAAIQRLVPPEQRATASAVFLFFSAILGSVGPLVTGMISDALRDSLGPCRWAAHCCAWCR